MWKDSLMTNEAEFAEFAGDVKRLKRRRQLHQTVEKRLSDILSRLFPESCSVQEVFGVLGGKNDLMQFFPNGGSIVFELFASPSQVPQDLRLLERSPADVKIAILLDRQIDPKLADKFFHSKPESFPFLWLSWVLMPKYEADCFQFLSDEIKTWTPREKVRVNYELKLEKGKSDKTLEVEVINTGKITLYIKEVALEWQTPTQGSKSINTLKLDTSESAALPLPPGLNRIFFSKGLSVAFVVVSGLAKTSEVWIRVSTFTGEIQRITGISAMFSPMYFDSPFSRMHIVGKPSVA